KRKIKELEKEISALKQQLKNTEHFLFFLEESDNNTYTEAIQKAKRIKQEMPTPSSFCRDGKWEKFQSPLIMNHRPSAAAIPITLYHPAFTHFQTNCSKINIEDKDCNQVQEFLNIMIKFYPKEACRLEKFREWASNYFGMPVKKLPLPRDHSEADIGITFSKSSNQFLLLIGEGKNEMGDGKGCPYIQACSSYAEYIGENEDTKMKYGLNPVFLLYLSGPYLGIAGAVFGKDFTVDPLTPMVLLFSLNHDPETMIHIVRILCSLKVGLQELVDYYQDLELPSNFEENGGLRPFSFPYFRSFTCNNKEISFQYIEHIEGKELLFMIKENNDGSTSCDGQNQCLLVKFTWRYGAEVHEFCASQGIASTLIAVNNLPGGWKMVITKPLHNEFTTLSYALNHIDDRQRIELLVKLKEIVHILHSEGYVHGYLCTSNVMISNTSDIKIINFDWAGREGNTKYPYFRNPKILWHPGVKGGKDILKEHDNYLLEKTFFDCDVNE
ncbi:11591_t:CDS:2, partial [Entrophospora sp. SA101]